MNPGFLFYDLETYGSDPRRSRIAQFAAIRTDEALREIDEPISFFVQPADDLLPSPVATLITGITPQQALRASCANRSRSCGIMRCGCATSATRHDCSIRWR